MTSSSSAADDIKMTTTEFEFSNKNVIAWEERIYDNGILQDIINFFLYNTDFTDYSFYDINAHMTELNWIRNGKKEYHRFNYEIENRVLKYHIRYLIKKADMVEESRSIYVGKSDKMKMYKLKRYCPFYYDK